MNLATLCKNIADAIRAKKGTSALINPQDFPTEIASIPTGTVSEPWKAVSFIDYDGTVVYSYTAAEFALLTEMPENPTRQGLTAQGWNWTLSDAQTYVATYGEIVIGQNYITDDGTTRLYITMSGSGRLSPSIFFQQSDANGIEVSWGDGATNTSSSTGNISMSHSYSTEGDYVITLKVLSGTLALGQGSTSGALMGGGNSRQVYRSMLKKVEMGNATLTANTLYDHKGIEAISIPTGVAMVQNCFYSCISLRAVVVPSGVTSLATSTFFGCYSLDAVSIPKSLATMNANGFSTVQTIGRITISDSIASIPASAFNSCYAISKFIIPSSVSAIAASAFANCYGVKIYDFSNHASVPTLADASAFGNIPSDCEIRVPAALETTWKTTAPWDDASIVGHIVGV